ncbi:DUF3558 domain-containing protein [Amycolatopsis sp. NBC_01488]|uniref:DUF3558 domain-containing protein n=1 Tax=Amycolatopsis sp. NBC_01488 TaxID=2903563 RepID=UPI002E2D1CF1|nr:DUF3558 domain-containing protein [Amycolatopsis sp. NBC_01488]
MSACTTPVSQQTPMATSGPSTPTGTSLTAPPVPSPLDTAKVEQDPCSALSQAQAAQVANLTSNRKSDGNVAPICTWTDSDHNSVAIGFVPANGGLATVYKNQDNKSGYFKVAPDVGGYPAAFFGAADFRNDGGCQIAVGVKNDEVFTVNVEFQNSSPYYSDPCAISAKAAEAVVSTLKGGA